MTARLFAAIEGGGTRFNCALVDDCGEFFAEREIATRDPHNTLSDCIEFFRSAAGARPIAAVGIACFGPLDINARSTDYGQVLGTPKPGWEGCNPGKTLGEGLGVPVAIDTDVAGSALGERHAGAARKLQSFVYITVGTGIGAAVVTDGAAMHGASHFEFGHIAVRRHPQDHFAGNCPFHGDCVSGLAAGPAIEARWAAPGESLDKDHPAWELEAFYLSQLCLAAIYSYAPEAIILAGGVMKTPGLLDKVRDRLATDLGGYHCGFFGSTMDDAQDQPPTAVTRVERGLLPPGLASRSALVGAYHMARALV